MSLFNEKIKLFNLNDLFVVVLFIFLVKILCISLTNETVNNLKISVVYNKTNAIVKSKIITLT